MNNMILRKGMAAGVFGVLLASILATACDRSRGSATRQRWTLVAGYGPDSVFAERQVRDSANWQVLWIKVRRNTPLGFKPRTRQDSPDLSTIRLFGSPAYSLAYVAVNCASSQLAIHSVVDVDSSGNQHPMNATGEPLRVIPESPEERIVDGVCGFVHER